MVRSPIDEAFDLYATTTDPRARQRAFSELVTLKALPRQIEDPRFSLGFEGWRLLLKQPDATEEERLLSVAELVRTGQIIKAKHWAERIAKAIEQALVEPLPPCSLLRDADERLNVARACSASTAEWMLPYIARAIAEEDAGEKARAEFLHLLIAHADSLAAAFALLGEAFAGLRFDTETPGDSMGKRLIRTLRALRPVLVGSLLESGDDAGKRFDGWLRTALQTSGKPCDEKTKIDLTRDVVLTIHDLVRTRLSMATEAETFAALKLCRGFFSGVSWPSELRETMDLLVQDVCEALLLLGRQDVPQQALLNQLELACGLKERARAIATQLADRHVELPERIRDWLRRGRLVSAHMTSNTLQLSLLDSNDVAVGLALVEIRRLASHAETMQRLIGTAEIYDPVLVGPATTYFQQVQDTIRAIQEVASRRGIILVGAEGEEREFSAKYFDPIRPLTRERTIVRRPAIVRTTTVSSVEEVLMKGLVE